METELDNCKINNVVIPFVTILLGLQANLPQFDMHAYLTQC